MDIYIILSCNSMIYVTALVVKSKCNLLCVVEPSDNTRIRYKLSKCNNVNARMV